MRHIIFLSVIILTLQGCGKHHSEQLKDSVPGPSGTSCTAKVVNGQKEVVCTDGSSFPVYDGANGQDGHDGANGSQGYGVGAVTSSASANECVNGGTDISFFADKNNNGLLDQTDFITSKVTVCNGANGQNGHDGTNGQNGHDGTNGQNGHDGTSSSVTVANANSSQCANGGIVITTVTANVSSSNTVCNGATGPQGQQGSAGVDLDSLSMVQFCSGTTTYPSSFPEFGMCVNNEVYAVYWDGHNSWLAKIAPGYYASTSTSAACNFTVQAGCHITH